MLVLACLLPLSVGCGPTDSPPHASDRVSAPSFPDASVVLISIDTLRSDRLPAYGYEKVATPAIDRLRQEGVLAARAYSPYPLTLPAHASMLTGLIPPEHGVRENLGYALDAGAVPYLPREFEAAGYRTGAFVSALVLRADTGLSEGFERYDDTLETALDDSRVGPGQRAGTDTVAQAVEWLEQLGSDERFFLFVHLYDPHTPYHAPSPFAERYADAYDAEIAAADDAVGRLFEALERLGRYQESVIVLTSDHGEGLGDHGEAEHGILLYREALQVPLIVRLPKGIRAGETLPSPVSLVDIAPTLRAMVGVGEPPDDRPTLWQAGAEQAPTRALYAETYYARLELGWSELGSIIEGPWHYIHGPDPGLYDLVADPAETINLRSEARRQAHAMRQAFEARNVPLEPPRIEDEEAARSLAALGYLSAPSLPQDGPLPDPGEMLPVLDTLRAIEQQGLDDPAGALEALAPLLEEHPQMAVAWLQQAQILEGTGAMEAALAAYRKTVSLQPGNPRASLGAGTVALRLGYLDEARALATQAEASHVSYAHVLTAQVAMAEGAFDEARTHAETSLRARPGGIASRLTLVMLDLRARDVASARARLDAVLALVPAGETTNGLDFAIAEVFAAEGRFDEAVTHFRAAITEDPRNPLVYERLATLHILQRRFQPALATIDEFLVTNPFPWAYTAASTILERLNNPSQAAAIRTRARVLFES